MMEAPAKTRAAAITPAPRPTAPRPQPSVRAAVADPITEGLFERVDGRERPARVSRDAWSKVFPPDYKRVRRLAGMHFLRGMEPDAAVVRACADIEMEAWRTGPLAALANVLSPLFPPSSDGFPHPCVQAAAIGVGRTASASWVAILGEPDARRGAFIHRRWHSGPGNCLVCGREVDTRDKAEMFQGDAIHRRCLPSMKSIGPAWGGMVVSECELHRTEAAARPAAEPLPDPGEDEEDQLSG